MKTMRDRLIELLSGKSIDTQPDVEYVADYLLENGVVLVDTNTVDFVASRKPIQTALGMPLDELSSLIEAKEEGRIIVLPCKVGDTVYDIKGQVIRIKGMGVDLLYSAEIVFDDEDPFPYFMRGGLRLPINFSGADFGKIVFLTKEEAEKALKGGE